MRNILKDKKFLFWDDYRPVEYAQETVEVPTFLSLFTGHPFEVQVSQSHNDGNVDFEWRRGAVMTAKEEGLWEPYGNVSQEDVNHMKSRAHVFTARAKIPKLADTAMCPRCMCLWIRDGAAEQDTPHHTLATMKGLGSHSSHSLSQLTLFRGIVWARWHPLSLVTPRSEFL